jgi:NAD(P)-dependent dehydrogenase (short-subunit alcohol dehydrogenase family)
MTVSAPSHLDGKVVVITGAASGIGAATACRFAELGAIVIAGDLDDAAGAELVAKLGDPHRYVHLDVTDYAAWERTLAVLADEIGGIDILFLNAGVMLRDRGIPNNDDPLLWLTKERSDRVVDVNLSGVLNGFVAAIPYLEARGGGHIILLGQVSVLAADPVYTMTKQALVGFTRAIGPSAALRGITVVGVRTSGADTPMIPPNVRDSGVPLNPPSRVADDLVTILAHAKSGEFWVISSAGDPTPPSPYQFPELPATLTQTINVTNSQLATAIGVPSIKN